VARISGTGRQLEFAPGRAPGWTEEQRSLLAALLGESVVDRLGLGSAEIDQLLRKQLLERMDVAGSIELSPLFFEALAPITSSLFSPFGASWSAQPFGAPPERAFDMHVNAEIIFYGGTHPDATVWVAGKQIALQPDGTFRYHFTLPDGDFNIPIVAESADKVEQRSATLSFRRETQREGAVGATPQPPNLDPLIGQK
jgi:hypothetical protein